MNYDTIVRVKEIFILSVQFLVLCGGIYATYSVWHNQQTLRSKVVSTFKIIAVVLFLILVMLTLEIEWTLSA
jgi:uncharacterized membrane protein YdjX (TVP38/TMEM64 family)